MRRRILPISQTVKHEMRASLEIAGAEATHGIPEPSDAGRRLLAVSSC
jgi:hypothetical protein